MAYVEWEPDRVGIIASPGGRGPGPGTEPQRLPGFPPSLTKPLGYVHYRLLGHCVLDAVIDQKTNPTNQLKPKLDAALGPRTDMDADRQEAVTCNMRQHML